LRDYIEKYNPKKYLGIDIITGKGVDEICNVIDLEKRYGCDSFDIVICTELIEHVKEWRVALNNMKKILKPGGIILITTRSIGFEYHGHPFDFWRYEKEDMEKMFSDFEIVNLLNDSACPGVFIKAIKKVDTVYVNLDDINLYSIINGKRCYNVNFREIVLFRIKLILVLIFRRIVPARLKPILKSLFKKKGLY
jgi:SAM-dependent methyltransferase